MRSVVAKTLVAVLVAVTALGFVAPIASAQDTYPPTGTILPTQGDEATPGDEDLAVINANAAARAAEQAAAAGAAAAASGDAASATAYAGKAQAYADKAAKLLADGKKAGFTNTSIARLEAAANRAAAAAAAASASAKAVATTPLAVSVPVPNLAFTGSSASLPAALGAAMVGAGGVALLFARKRELAQG